MNNFIDSSFDVDYKKWYCPDPNCSWHKTKMTIEDNLDHMIKIHNMKPPAGYEVPIKLKSANKKKNKSKRR